MSSWQEHRARQAVVEAARRLNASGLNQGTSGNVSVRFENGLLLTPSGMPYEAMTPDDIMYVHFDGSFRGNGRPSSEWRIHRDVQAKHPEVGAVIHAHPMFCTVLACQRRPIPAFHYMVAIAGGEDIRCADYATFGSEALSHATLAALHQRRACLLANHGMVATGRDLDEAFKLAQEVETLAAMYWRTLQGGTPVLLDGGEMQRVLAQFGTYGR